jgi:hypothetical protein
LLLPLLAIGCVDKGPDPSRPFYIVKDGRLANGLDLSVDAVALDGNHTYDLAHFESSPAQIRYPPLHVQGRVTFVLGIYDPAHRLYENFSRFGALEIRMSGSFPLWSVAVQVESLDPPYWGACALRPPSSDADGSHEYRVPFEAIRPAYGSADYRFWAPAVLAMSGPTAFTLKLEELRINPASSAPAPCDCLCGAAGCVPGCEGDGT